MESTGVLIVAEVAEGRLSPISYELLGCGRRLADSLKELLGCILISPEASTFVDEIQANGADTVFVTDSPQLTEYLSESWLPVVTDMARKSQPKIILLGQTDLGRDLAPRLAFRLGVALSTDCVELEIESGTGRLLQTRPAYGGNALATFVTDTVPQIATIRQKAMARSQRQEGRKAEVVPVTVNTIQAALKTRNVGKTGESASGVRLEDASVVVSGGRGIGGAEGFKQLQELAGLLNGAVGASRPPCDSNWAPTTTQVGLTGKIVAPDLYIAVGISGASQHLAGCSGAKVIVAINRDVEANIFKQSCYAAVGDWKQILPAFIAKVRELKAK